MEFFPECRMIVSDDVKVMGSSRLCGHLHCGWWWVYPLTVVTYPVDDGGSTPECGQLSCVWCWVYPLNVVTYPVGDGWSTPSPWSLILWVMMCLPPECGHLPHGWWWIYPLTVVTYPVHGGFTPWLWSLTLWVMVGLPPAIMCPLRLAPPSAEPSPSNGSFSIIISYMNIPNEKQSTWGRKDRYYKGKMYIAWKT